MKTATDYECFGCFDLGDSREFASGLFSKLAGMPEDGKSGILHMDLVEKYRGLPVNIDVISCSIDDVCRNVRVITHELFKHINLGEEQA